MLLLLQVPLRVLQHRVRQVGNHTVAQGRVDWTDSSPCLATWEDLEFLQQFPRAPAWGQAGTQGSGDASIPDHLPDITEEQTPMVTTSDGPVDEPTRREGMIAFEDAGGPSTQLSR